MDCAILILNHHCCEKPDYMETKKRKFRVKLVNYFSSEIFILEASDIQLLWDAKRSMNAFQWEEWVNHAKTRS